MRYSFRGLICACFPAVYNLEFATPENREVKIPFANDTVSTISVVCFHSIDDQPHNINQQMDRRNAIPQLHKNEISPADRNLIYADLTEFRTAPQNVTLALVTMVNRSNSANVYLFEGELPPINPFILGSASFSVDVINGTAQIDILDSGVSRWIVLEFDGSVAPSMLTTDITMHNVLNTPNVPKELRSAPIDTYQSNGLCSYANSVECALSVDTSDLAGQTIRIAVVNAPDQLPVNSEAVLNTYFAVRTNEYMLDQLNFSLTVIETQPGAMWNTSTINLPLNATSLIFHTDYYGSRGFPNNHPHFPINHSDPSATQTLSL